MEVFGFAVELWKWCPVLDLALPGVGEALVPEGAGGRFPVPDPLMPGRGRECRWISALGGGSGRDSPGAQS